MAEIPLQGCTPEPLMGYMKALGVFRLVSEQADQGARGFWRDGLFVLKTKLDRDALTHFFLDQYHPTPIIAPWAGGSGFFGSDNRAAVDAIMKSKSDRLAKLADLIATVRELLKKRSLKEKPAPDVKEDLLRQYRRDMPDEFVNWMDTALVLQSAGQAFPPLLGTGGNDGRLDFTQNYMQRLVALGLQADHLVPGAEAWLRQALFGEAARDLLSAAVGQFDPGRAGGPNATMGMEGDALVNPWDFILMLEGSLMLAGAAARRMGANQRDRAAFPFTVRASSVGYASEADRDEPDSRGEIWLPLWQTPTTISELSLVFSEGRSEYNGHQSRDGVDFARAVASLGVDRGLTAFTRYGFLKRSGKSYVATPLGTFAVREQRSVDLLREVDGWLEPFRRACSGDEVPSRFKVARRRIDAAIFDYCRYSQGEDAPSRLQNVLAAIGGAERELAVGEMPTDKRRVRRPLAGLSSDWIKACDDGSPEYRVSRSLAFIYPKKTGPIRRFLEPIKFEKGRWVWAERGGHVVWSGGSISRNLGAVLTRRLMDAEKAGEASLPLDSRFPASLADVADFMLGQIDDQKLEDLLWGLMLVDPIGAELVQPSRDDGFLSSAYALLKLTLLPWRLRWSPYEDRVILRTLHPEEEGGIIVKPEPGITSRLQAGDIQAACEIAIRRLRASGLPPLATHHRDGSRRDITWSTGNTPPDRLLAALLFPIPESKVNALADLVLQRPEVESLS